jgi:hypothetical protein
MSGRAKSILVFVVAGALGFLIYRASERTWSSRVTAMVVRTFQSAPIQTGDLPTFQVELLHPTGSMAANILEIPGSVFSKLMPRDSYERSVRSLPFLGLQAYHHKATRDGQTVAEWDEGFPLLWAGVAGSALVAGIVVSAVVALLLGALGLKKAPNV